MYEYIVKFTNEELPGQRIRSNQWLDVGTVVEINQPKGKVIASVAVVTKKYSQELQDYDAVLHLDLLQYLVNLPSQIKRFYLPDLRQFEQKKLLN
ncbi:hypothetical protein ACL6C3_11650 [Capilliphycus salinus ALCB114379]|uniref:hypothetical protein n=1 Tax=Capilliphycus salinus TaxID=2768948 RepID=UPI0039A50895